DDTNLKALQALNRLYEVKQAWRELADNLARQLTLTDDNLETIALLTRLADLREQRLGEVAAAIDTYRLVLEAQPDNEQAQGALERLLKLPEHEQAVAQILEPIYQGGDQGQRLVEVYEIQ